MKVEFARFKGYGFGDVQKDLVAGLTIGVIAIPLGMAFAIASGVKPEYGLYTTIIAGILISLLGGSRYQIGGPTGAFIPILLAIVMQYGYEDLLIAGFLAGIMLVIMGVFRLGTLIKFIPRPVTIGFTAGIAVIIFSGQISNFLGLTGIEKHEEFILNMKEIVLHLNTINRYSIITALISLVIILLTPKFFPKVPGSLIGLLFSSIIAYLIFRDQIPTIGSTFGDIKATLPTLQIPELSWERVEKLLPSAFIIAMLGGIESLLSAVVADGMTGERHNSNKELIGQGVANIITPLFGGIPATGAIARTATNIKSGAVSPLSGIIHGFVVLLILLVLAPYAIHIPLASMAPILMIVAWNMSERKEFVHVLKTKTGDSVVLLITFLLTVFTDLTTAVEIGLVLAVILFIKRMSELITVSMVLPDPEDQHHHLTAIQKIQEKGHSCPQISIYTIEGPLFFGAAQFFAKSIMDTIKYHPKVLILQMGKVPYMDITGEANLSSIVQHFLKKDGKILVTGIKNQPREMLEKTGLYHQIGAENFYLHTSDAIDVALEMIETEQCRACQGNAFSECRVLAAPVRKVAGIKQEQVLVES